MEQVLGIVAFALLFGGIIGREMVITIVVFAGIMLAMKVIVLVMVPVPIGILMAFGIISFIGLLFVARYLAQVHTEKKYPRENLHIVRAEMVREVC